MATQTTLTSQGLKDLEERLEHLKSVTRKEIAEKIKVALSFGDLSENSEYDEAKNEQGIVEAEIAEIEATLKNAKVVDEDELSTEHVNIGNTVVIEDESGKKINIEYNFASNRTTDKGKAVLALYNVKKDESVFADNFELAKGYAESWSGDNAVVTKNGVKKYKIVEIDK